MLSAGKTLRTGTLIIRNEGFLSLYRGAGITMAISAPALASYLFTYDQVKIYLLSKQKMSKRDKMPNGGLGIHLVSGITAEIVSGLFWTPMEVIKQRLQASNPQNQLYKGSFRAFPEILKTEGFRGFYRGYFTTLGVFIPHSAIFFTTYEKLKYLTDQRTDHVSFMTLLGISTFAAGLSAAVTNPLDIIKTRWQVQVGDGRSNSWLGMSYKSPLDVAVRILREEGIGAFKNGMFARVLWLAPSTAIAMSSYEKIKANLKVAI